MSRSGAAKSLVSVGVPVFNEEEYLGATLDSLLAQDYERLQFVVCDNASTDASLAIAREYAARDSRIEVHASDENRGAAWNFNRCFELASGEYFTWAGGHDSRLPPAIRLCVEALEADPRLVLCYPRSLRRYLDGTTSPIVHDTIDTRGLSPILRLRKTIERLWGCNAVYGVICSEALAATRLSRSCFGFDHVLLAELSLLGEFRQLEDVLFIRTENRPAELDEQRLARTFQMVGVADRGARAKPYTVMGAEHVRGVWHVLRGVHRITSSVLAAFWFARRWRNPLAAEWHLARPARVAALGYRRLPFHPKSRARLQP